MLRCDGSTWRNDVTLGAANGVCPLGPDGRVPSEYAPSGITLVGGWDAAINDPDLAAGAPYEDGSYWICTTAGSTDLNGITTWNVGDWVMYIVDEPGNWIRVANGTTVTAVFGRTGSIVATGSDYNAFYDTLGAAATVQGNLDTHAANFANPHAVTKTQVGLANANNTSDADKPVSNAQQAALDLKEDTANKGASNGYCELDSLQTVPASRLRYGYGNMNLSGSVAGPNIGGAWDPITQYDQQEVLATNCSLDETAGTVAFNREGVWDLRIQFNMNHNDTSGGRSTNIRLFNVTSATAGGSVPVYIGTQSRRNRLGQNDSRSNQRGRSRAVVPG